MSLPNRRCSTRIQENNARSALSRSNIDSNRSSTSSETTHRIALLPHISEVESEFPQADTLPNDSTKIDIPTLWHHLPVLTVISSKPPQNLTNEGVRIVPKYTASFPTSCYQALKGQEEGVGGQKKSHILPGIPSRKLTSSDVDKYANIGEYWDIQAIYYLPENSDQVLVKYVGWDASAIFIMDSYDVSRAFKKEMKEVDTRNAFLEQIMRVGPHHMKDFAKREKVMDPEIQFDKSHKFWLYEDISYFHSKIQEENRLGKLVYMCLEKPMKFPPRYAFSATSVAHEKVYKEILKSNLNKKFVATPIQASQASKMTQMELGSCEKPSTCTCNRKFAELIEIHPNHPDFFRKNYQHDAEGLLNLDEFDHNQQRIVMECSDICGCTWQCPRRQLQRGSQKTFVVFYEDNVRGFGLRAGHKIRRGEFIGEYTGEMMLVDGDYNKDRDTSYDAEFNILGKFFVSALNVGNYARFLSHSCSPSACFMETFSRRFESDPLVPRISVYALNDIDVGEEITIRYYEESDMRDSTGIKCKCQVNCPNYLPM